MCVTLLVLALLGALVLAALDHPSTQAAAAVALILPPAKDKPYARCSVLSR